MVARERESRARGGSEGEPAPWAGQTALDVLASKRRLRISPSEKSSAGASGALPPQWQAQLRSYLLDHAEAHLVSSTVSAQAAAQQMLNHKRSFLVVVDRSPSTPSSDALLPRKVSGIVTERSFLHFASEWAHGYRTLDVTTCETINPVSSNPRAVLGDHEPTGGAISGIMTPIEHVLHVELADPASKLIDIFFTKNVTHVPVVERGALVGIVSIRDVVKAYVS